MKKIKSLDIVVIGFALFSMYFGAGNVVFPPFLGFQSGVEWVKGFAAYYFADVVLAIVAIFAILRDGNSEMVLNRIGKNISEVIMSAVVLCIGPMLAIPRTAATTYELGISNLIPWMPSWVFAAIFFAVVLLLTIRESAVIDILGEILTPILLLGLFALIIVGIINPLGTIESEPIIENVTESGIQSGYQTMDVLASLVFGMIIIKSALDKGYDDGKTRFFVLIRASILAGILLLLVYFGLAYLGATVSGAFDATIGRSDLVIQIVVKLLGQKGMILFAVVVSAACLTTAIGLTSCAAEHFSRLSNGRISYKMLIIIICIFSAAVSNFGLDFIVSVAAPILDLVYPIVLVLIIISIVFPKLPKKVCVYATVGAFLTSVLNIISTYGKKIALIDNIPLANLGMNWIIPSAIFGVFGYMMYRISAAKKE